MRSYERATNKPFAFFWHGPAGFVMLPTMEVLMFRRASYLLVLAGLVAASAVHAAAPVVSNVRASQRAGTKLVDIYYDLSDSDSGSLYVSIAVSVNDGATYDLPAASFSDGGGTKSIGGGVSPGYNRWIVWNAGADWNGQFSSIVKFRVTADDASGVYLVIDLSGGPSASSYPVSYLTAAPPGGWTDEHKTTKLVLRKIPHGTFTMGYRATDYPGASDSGLHEVTLTKDFYIGVFEVTQKQWERVMGNWPSYFNNASYRDSRPVEQVSYYDIRENPNNSAISPNWPQSSQVHADSFMGKLRAKTGLTTLDLPTESQWEYACRGQTTTALNSGYNLTNTSSDVRVDAVGRYWYNGGSGYSQGGDTSVATAKAGTYLANAWGLYDMHGNAWEWCLDWYGTYPGAVSDPPGAASGSVRVLRGGGWYYVAGYCRSAIRDSSSPYYRDNGIGFRVARTLP
jgi:formylglycine-generating enzyme required for sulfatase activity